MFCVLISGVHYPSLASLCSQKVVESERGFLMSTVGSGSYLGWVKRYAINGDCGKEMSVSSEEIAAVKCKEEGLIWKQCRLWYKILISLSICRCVDSFIMTSWYLFAFKVKLMNAFLKRKTWRGLAQANWNDNKSFVKLNCNNIANTI